MLQLVTRHQASLRSSDRGTLASLGPDVPLPLGLCRSLIGLSVYLLICSIVSFVQLGLFKMNDAPHRVKFRAALHAHAQPFRLGQSLSITRRRLYAVFDYRHAAVISKFVAAVDLGCGYAFAAHHVALDVSGCGRAEPHGDTVDRRIAGQLIHELLIGNIVAADPRMTTRHLAPRTCQAMTITVRQADHTRHHFV